MIKRIAVALTACLVLASAHGQLVEQDPDWKEIAVPPAPAYEKKRLIRFDVSNVQTLVFGVDPATISIGQDGVVRYVVVASSQSGVVNAMYEAIRCSTAEVKTYARRIGESDWFYVKSEQWKTMRDSVNSRHAWNLARQGICDGRAHRETVPEMVRTLRSSSNDQR